MNASPARTRGSHILETVTHILTALVIFLKGCDKVVTPGKVWIGIAFIGVALFIVTGTVLHHRFSRVFKHLKAYIFLLEACVLLAVGYLYKSEGKQFLPYACYAAAAGFLIALIIYLARHKRN